MLYTNAWQTAKVASNCIRTLLLQTPKSPADQSIVRYLLPLLINFVTTTSNEDPDNARSLVCHALTAYSTILKGQQKAIAMSVFVPTLLRRAKGDGEATYRETSARLLELAASDQAAFKVIVSGLTLEQRTFMEGLLLAGRQAGQAGKVDTDEEEDKEPTIALRMDFGG